MRRLVICLIAAFGLFAAAAPAMDMGSGSPEHVADAVAALRAHHNAEARTHLKTAIKTMGEPKAARDHAKEALAQLNAGHAGKALEHAVNGAAVEHLTYALSALQAGKNKVARGHLTETEGLLPYAAAAKRALAALNAGKHAKAISITRSALHAAVTAM